MSSVAPLPAAKKVAYVSFMADVTALTAQALMAQCAQLVNQGKEVIYLLFSMPGGQVREGMAIYNLLVGLPAKIITHNVGNVDSIGNVIFLAGEERYACPNATFMFHGVGVTYNGQPRLEEKNLLESLGSVQADTARMARVIRDRASFPDADEIGKLFLEASTRDADYAKSRGIVHEIRDVSIPRGSPVFQLVFQR